MCSYVVIVNCLIFMLYFMVEIYCEKGGEYVICCDNVKVNNKRGLEFFCGRNWSIDYVK